MGLSHDIMEEFKYSWLSAYVGAGIVVTKSVSANSTIVGSPARINRIGDNDD